MSLIIEQIIMIRCIIPQEIKDAYLNIKGDILKTPLEYSPKLSTISGACVYLKMEHLQHTGSFKLRGVLNKIKSLHKEDFQKTFIATSTGNHAAAFASKAFEFDAVLFMPENASEMYESIVAGSIVPPSTLTTISDATAGGIEANSLTFDICKNQFKDFELIDESEIKEALAFIVRYHQTIIETGAVLPVAALLHSKKYTGKNVVLVLTKKNKLCIINQYNR